MKQIFLVKWCTLLICILLHLPASLAQNVEQPRGSQVETISNDDLQKRVNELEYDKKKTIYSLKEFIKNKKEEKPKPRKNFSNFDLSSIGIVIKAILYTALAIFVIAIIYFIFKDIRDKKINLNRKFAVNENFEVDDIEKLEIDTILDDALKSGNYRFAIRLKFLRILQLLQEKNLIKWKKNKTNRTYVSEFQMEEHRLEFKKLAGIFDNIWYGEIFLSIEEYQYIEQIFDHYIQTLKP